MNLFLWILTRANVLDKVQVLLIVTEQCCRCTLTDFLRLLVANTLCTC